MTNKKKLLLAVACMALAVCSLVTGTLAWLTTKTDPVVNTFTTSDINITLEESDNLDFKMVPGGTITKDPVVTVLDGSEDCWLFVKIVETNNTFGDGQKYLTYAIAEGWTELPGADGVYYRKVTSNDDVKSFSVLSGDQVTVSGDVTKAMMNAMDGITANSTNDATELANRPKLTITAYACQLMNGDVAFTPSEAWQLCP